MPPSFELPKHGGTGATENEELNFDSISPANKYIAASGMGTGYYTSSTNEKKKNYGSRRHVPKKLPSLMKNEPRNNHEDHLPAQIYRNDSDLALQSEQSSVGGA